MSATKKKKTAWFGMKVTPEQKEKIKKLARRRGVTQTKAVMDLVEKEVREESSVEAKPSSFYERNKDLIGVAEGPGDLSTSPKYIEGYGR